MSPPLGDAVRAGLRTVWTHKWLTLRAIVTGWIALFALWIFVAPRLANLDVWLFYMDIVDILAFWRGGRSPVVHFFIGGFLNALAGLVVGLSHRQHRTAMVVAFFASVLLISDLPRFVLAILHTSSVTGLLSLLTASAAIFTFMRLPILIGAVRVFVVLLVVVPSVAAAQSTSHGYASVGAGATELNGGGHVRFADTPIGLGGEMGLGWVLLASVNATYHLVDPRPQDKVDPFVTAGYMSLISSEFTSNGVAVGGGLIYWAGSRVGVRLDAFRFLPVSTDNNIRPEERSPSRYWGVRVGVAFRARS